MSIPSKLHRYYQRKAASLLYRKPLLVRPSEALISFTFDDFPRSALLAGGSILNRFGLAGTYYAALGLMGTVGPSGDLFVADDLVTLFEQGHELGCHTYAHCDSWTTSPKDFESSIEENRRALGRLVPGADLKTFSYPISLPRPATKAKVARHFVACRAGGQTLNSGTVDRNQLSAYFLEQGRHDPEAIKNLIRQNQQSRGWLILATHDVAENPSRFGITPALFEQVVRWAIASNARILPVIGALAELHVPGAHKAERTCPDGQFV